MSIEPTMLRPAQAALLLGVTTTTLSRWADQGKIAFRSTPGGHRRYPADQFERPQRKVKRRTSTNG